MLIPSKGLGQNLQQTGSVGHTLFLQRAWDGRAWMPSVFRTGPVLLAPSPHLPISPSFRLPCSLLADPTSVLHPRFPCFRINSCDSWFPFLSVSAAVSARSGQPARLDRIFLAARHGILLRTMERDIFHYYTHLSNGFMSSARRTFFSDFPILQDINRGRVERWRGGVGFAYSVSGFPRLCLNSRMPCSVSTSRSSNRTGGFPASGSPTGFTVKPTITPCGATFA